jgi:hypothetical protein
MLPWNLSTNSRLLVILEHDVLSKKLLSFTLGLTWPGTSKLMCVRTLHVYAATYSHYSLSLATTQSSIAVALIQSQYSGLLDHNLMWT